jgi:V/A-type H+-transporting ATPase subunit I
MSLTPAKMKFLDLVILDRDSRRITTALGRMGVLELVKLRPEEAAGQPALPDRRPELDSYRALAARLDAVLEKLGLRELPASSESSYEPIEVIEQKILRLEGRVQALLDRRAKIEAESERIQDKLVRFDLLGAVTVPLSQVLESPFLHFAVGSIRATDLAKLQAITGQDFVFLSGETRGEWHNLIAVTSRKCQAELDAQLKQHNFVTEDISPLIHGAPAAILDEMQKRLDQIRGEQEGIFRELSELAQAEAQKIASVKRSLDLELALVEASLNFSRTESTCRISGWLPADQVGPASRQLLQETGGRLFIQVREPKETDLPPEDVPVLIRDNPLVRPFQLLVTAFGLPRYRELQPTALMALSFLVMYGLMFGDVGQGAVLVLAGLAVRKSARTPQIRDLGAIIALAGTAATVFGFLYGSLFGKLGLLPVLWIDPMEDVVKMLIAPVALGILLMSVGILVNIVNKFRCGDYFRAIFDRIGIMGIVLYWGALGLGLRSALVGAPAHLDLLLVLLILAPLLVILFREAAYEQVVHKGHESEGVLLALMTGGVDVMETLTGFLANTVSFVRVGAFALAHAGLCMAIYGIVSVVTKWPAGGLWSAAVIVLGNAIIILLEGMVVFVQDLRLEYYEFFSKFFEGAGRRYSPFRIG